jgi:hypothetical protein
MYTYTHNANAVLSLAWTEVQDLVLHNEMKTENFSNSGQPA